MKNLLIVESPTKAKTLKKYLGANYMVKASGGHVIDLPKSRLGVDVESGFKPHYTVIRGKASILRDLRNAAKNSDNIFLAPDPDREGEAIAWHIAEHLRKENTKIFRVTFNEITKNAVSRAIKEPHQLDQNLFEAQQARRILDRIVGYELSPILWRKVQRGLSAGRVQSVAVRLIVEREREIENFKSEEYWTVHSQLATGANENFWARLIRYKGEKAEKVAKQLADQVVNETSGQPFSVASVEKKRQNRQPQPPYITSRLQRDSAMKLRFTARQTMMIAQQLYEGVEIGGRGAVGLITYMRTDSFRVAQEAIDEVRKFIGSKFGDNYLPEQPNFYRSKKGSQDAHEAIRPTDVNITPEEAKAYLSRDQYLLYKLIWERFVSSQMGPAVYDQTIAEFKCADAIFRATGNILVFEGWQKLFPENGLKEDEEANDNDNEEKLTRLPELKTGENLDAKKVEGKQHFTQPPPRYNEGSLVRELEEKGIGRPSTYATIVSTIQEKSYVEKIDGKLRPTHLGKVVTDLLVENFSEIMDVAFTAGMEEKLDAIEEGKVHWDTLLQEFYSRFHPTLKAAETKIESVKQKAEPTGIKCDKPGCTGEMVVKWGKRGQFLGCSRYPECDNTKAFKRDESGNIVISVPPKEEKWHENCPVCGSQLVVRFARGGRFIACSNYPNCRVALPFPIEAPCPKCGKVIAERRSRHGKLFYGCTGYPECDFVSWNKPVNKACPKCEQKYLVIKKNKEGKLLLACLNKECHYQEEIDELKPDNLEHVNITHLYKPGTGSKPKTKKASGKK